jgi:hypothetical protein
MSKRVLHIPSSFARCIRPSTNNISRSTSLFPTNHYRHRTFSSTTGRMAIKEAPQTDQPAVSEKLPDPKDAKNRLREFELADRIFIVTGGGQGLGLTIAEALVEAGGKGTWPLTDNCFAGACSHIRNLNSLLPRSKRRARPRIHPRPRTACTSIRRRTTLRAHRRARPRQRRKDDC